MADRHTALAREEIIEALTAYAGITTADGATPGNNTLIDSLLIGRNDFITGKTILIGAGYDASYEDKGASAFDSLTGQITVAAAFSAQIKKGTFYRVLNISSGSSVSSLLTPIETNTNLIPGIQADTTLIQAALARKFSFLDFWSAPSDKVTIVNAPVVDIPFPNIVVIGLPTGLSVKRVVLIMSARALNNTAGAANFINAAGKTIRIKTAAGAWGTDDIVAITFANNSLYTKGSTKEPGPVIIGGADLSAVVTGNATYNVRSDQSTRGDALVANANSLELYDIQVGLRVFYS